MARRSSLLLGITLGGVLILFAGLVTAMWRLDFFSFTGTDPSLKIVVAALALA